MADEEEIHEVRLSIKRLNALAAFLGKKKYFRKEFKGLGLIRNKQIIENLIYHYSNKKYNKRIFEYPEITFSNSLIIRLGSILKKLDNLKNKQDKFDRYQYELTDYIRREEDLHEIRKMVKSLCFIMKELNTYGVSSHLYSYNRLKALEKKLGSWHDLQLLLNFLEKKSSLENNIIGYMAASDCDLLEEEVRHSIIEIFLKK